MMKIQQLKRDIAFLEEYARRICYRIIIVMIICALCLTSSSTILYIVSALSTALLFIYAKEMILIYDSWKIFKLELRTIINNKSG